MYITEKIDNETQMYKCEKCGHMEFEKTENGYKCKKCGKER